MAYTKPLVTTTVYYHEGTDPIVFADAVVDGKTVRYGSTVRKQILDEKTIESVANDTKTYVIPYHAVIKAEIATADSAEITPATDDFCKE